MIEQQSIKEIEYERILSSFERVEKEKTEIELKCKELKKAIEANQINFSHQIKSNQALHEKQLNELVPPLLFDLICRKKKWKF